MVHTAKLQSPPPARSPVRLAPRRGLLLVPATPVERPAGAAQPDRGVRSTVAERCAELGFRLTEKRRQLVELLDRVDAPLVLETVWWKARELGIDINRSSLHRLVADLVSAGVLIEWGPGDRRTRYTTPVAAPVEIETADGAACEVEDQTLAEMLVEAFAQQGMAIGARRIVITLKD